MKTIFVVSFLVTFATAQYPNSLSDSHYSAPPSYSSSGVPPQPSYGAPQQSYQGQGGSQQSSFGVPQQSYPPPVFQQQQSSNAIQESENKIVFKHVFVHVAKDDEPVKQQIRTIKGPGGNEKHVKIIFVKAPAAAAPDQQVVELAQANERKTLVYVLLKKAADAPDVKFANPAPTSASKPEVYFIRYRDQKPTGETPSGSPGTAYGAPVPIKSGY